MFGLILSPMQMTGPSTADEIFKFVDAGGTLAVIILVIVLVVGGTFRLKREMDQQQIAHDAEKETWAAEKRALSVEVATWQAAYQDQARAREAAERTASNALTASDLIQSLVSSLQQVSGQRGSTGHRTGEEGT